MKTLSLQQPELKERIVTLPSSVPVEQPAQQRLPIPKYEQPVNQGNPIPQYGSEASTKVCFEMNPRIWFWLKVAFFFWVILSFTLVGISLVNVLGKISEMEFNPTTPVSVIDDETHIHQNNITNNHQIDTKNEHTINNDNYHTIENEINVTILIPESALTIDQCDYIPDCNCTNST